MMVLTIVLAPLSFALLFGLMSWTERILDHQLERQVSVATSRAVLLGGKGPPSEPSALVGQAAAR
jgi:hypothetical protein